VRRALALALTASLAFATPAAAEWHSQQPLTAGIRAELGQIGDVEFWAPNRGVLITAGNGGVAAGVFAYDGTGWYRYSTVCGGHEGRIAWAGPDEFWTISDQPLGQGTGQAPPSHISLCHFKDGQVVASYAEPVGLAGSYLEMDAAACNGPNNCWFGGKRLPGFVNDGAFHLHWDGSSLTAIPSLTQNQPQIADPGRDVKSLAFYGGGLYEAVQVQESDIVPEETEPVLLHTIDPSQPNPFAAAALKAPIAGVNPRFLEGFRFSGEGGTSLWAVSGASDERGQVTALRKVGGEPFAQLTGVSQEGVFEPGDAVTGLAAEPSDERVWVGFRGEAEIEGSYSARLTRVHADGTLDEEIRLPTPGEELGPHGAAGPIACPAPEQCWMATERGWLFHLGPDLPQDTDPAMHALIDFRPPDDSLPFVPPVELPEDDSGAISQYEYQALEELPQEEGKRSSVRGRPVLTGLNQKVIGNRLLELTFVLHAKAHVRLIAKYKRAVVASTPRYTMGKGHRSLRLQLDPKRWPTKLDLQVHAVKKKGSK
jgi:hypothetical protein